MARPASRKAPGYLDVIFLIPERDVIPGPVQMLEDWPVAVQAKFKAPAIPPRKGGPGYLSVPRRKDRALHEEEFGQLCRDRSKTGFRLRGVQP